MRRNSPYAITPTLLCLLAIASCGKEESTLDEARVELSRSQDLSDALRESEAYVNGRHTPWPLHSRSEVDLRPNIQGGHVLGQVSHGSLSAHEWDVNSLTARFVEHAENEHVICIGEMVWIVSEPVALPSIDGVDPAVIARRDGNAVFDGVIDIPVSQPDQQLVLLGLASPLISGGRGLHCEFHSASNRTSANWHQDEGHTDALIFNVREAGTVRIELHDRALDQAYFAHARIAPSGDMEDVPIQSGAKWQIDLPSEPAAGRSWTLITCTSVNLSDHDPARSGAQPNTKSSLHDITDTSGIQFVHFEGPDLQLDIRPTMGPGAAWGDVNGDGWHDLYLVQGGGRDGVTSPNRLYKNLGEGKFEDITATAGVGDKGAGMGALFFDANGDGYLDLYVANYGTDVLYQGNADGTFTDVTAAAGIDSSLWSASAAAADADGDGDLDLYITRYLDFDLDKMPPPEALGGYERDDPPAMLPFAFPGQPNLFLRNESDGDGIRFIDATQELGLANAAGLGMQAIWWDYDSDGDQDLYVANDVTPNVLYRNNGGTFEDVTFGVGLDDPRGGMGLAVGDVEGDGDEDVFLTNWQLETNALYLNLHKRPYGQSTRRARFRDGTLVAALGGPSIGVTSWGAVLFDLEHDGDLDLFVANGYTSPDYATTGICVGQPNHLYIGDGSGKFSDGSEIGGPALDIALASRGAVGCDWDRDGDVDILVTANNGRVQLLENRSLQEGHWISFILDCTAPNPFGVGAVVTIEHGGRTLRRTLRAGEGYLTSAAPELHFGLGPKDGKITAKVTWPSGAETVHADLEPDKRHRLSID